jgi:hypothetical protein
MLNGFGYLEAVKDVIVDGKYDGYAPVDSVSME